MTTVFTTTVFTTHPVCDMGRSLFLKRGCVMRMFVGLVAGLLATSAAPAAVTVHTAAFITNVTGSTDFEALPDGGTYPRDTVFSDGGLNVSYVSTDTYPLPVFTTYGITQSGTKEWYAVGGYGYTSISRTDGGSFNQIGFNAGSGYYLGSNIEYELLLGGSILASGTAGFLNFGEVGYFGLSGLTFDQVLLKGAPSPDFDAGASDALGIDNVAIGTERAGAVPEPATWAMMIAGFGAIGTTMRRRRVAVSFG